MARRSWRSPGCFLPPRASWLNVQARGLAGRRRPRWRSASPPAPDPAGRTLPAFDVARSRRGGPHAQDRAGHGDSVAGSRSRSCATPSRRAIPSSASPTASGSSRRPCLWGNFDTLEDDPAPAQARAGAQHPAGRWHVLPVEGRATVWRPWPTSSVSMCRASSTGRATTSTRMTRRSKKASWLVMPDGPARLPDLGRADHRPRPRPESGTAFGPGGCTGDYSGGAVGSGGFIWPTRQSLHLRQRLLVGPSGHRHRRRNGRRRCGRPTPGSWCSPAGPTAATATWSCSITVTAGRPSMVT